jgi:hypothetical protein
MLFPRQSFAAELLHLTHEAAGVGDILSLPHEP